ncbi:MAG: GTPase ObgE [Firmicutes bacterium ADurb.Bin193]|nr:MAG: GTPase ObgE [Firmicutes bacterium ADurb.Bin193]
MFVDIAQITVKAGNGGNGCVSFHREKYVAAGGPDGGDGGDGGSVILCADSSLSTLMDFRYRKKFCAQNGADGRGGKMSGKRGEDLIIRVPKGTLVKDTATGAIIADLSKEGDTFVAAKGGSGGWGNARFATPTRQAPNFAKSGRMGKTREITLELKLIADVGLIGFPNVGKSTILSVVSHARPKIADYHFTTLVPNLGVVRIGDGSMVVADIPGIIEGAHKGAGLGHEFLRHIERTRLLVHVVDVSGSEGRNPIEDFDIINSELSRYSAVLAEKNQVIAANKTDVSTELLAEFTEEMEKRGFKVFAISAAAGKGLNELMNYCYNTLKTIPVPEFDVVEIDEDDAKDESFTVEFTDGVYVVSGDVIYNLVNSTNFDDNESLSYFQRTLRRLGVIDELEKAGIAEGDTVRLFDVEFEYNK